jgi:methylenetetrahydrofolate dehydrogenase (NADP+)/methenyltetrahydrofolate cyclohydrolase
MTARIIDGKGFADAMRGRIARQVGALAAAHGVRPGLAAVLVGDDPASQVYVRNKEKQAAEAGIVSIGRRLPPTTDQSELLDVVRALNADPAVDGILVQLPLPNAIDPQAIVEAVDPAKDVDGFHPMNAGRLASGRAAMTPCTPLGCMMLLEHTLGRLTGLNALVIGRSAIVGRPLGQLLLAADCTVTVAHSKSRDLAAIARGADILIAAVGRPQMVRGDWIKPGAAVIDVGINRVPADGGKSRLVGDVAFDEAVQVAGAITPVPGGVGPMTIACLLANTLAACCRRRGIPLPADSGA